MDAATFEKSIPWPVDNISEWPIDRLLPYARNARQHSERQIEQIVASIQQWGWTNPVLVDEGGTIIAGHGRVMAAQRLGIASVPVMVARGWTDRQKRAYAIADNQLALSSTWDLDLLKSELAELAAAEPELPPLTGFTADELRVLLPERPLEESDDDLPEAPRMVTSRPGDVWVLGHHRVLCGDSTDPDAVAQLMQGERADLVFTSPPYGQQRNYTGSGVSDWDRLMCGVFAALPVTDDAQVLVNLGLIHRGNEWQPYWDPWVAWMREHGWRRFAWYVWDQGPGLPGDWAGRLAPCFEFVFHFNRVKRYPHKNVASRHAGEVKAFDDEGLRRQDGKIQVYTFRGRAVSIAKKPDSVIRINRASSNGIAHPAIFPVGLPQFVMEAYSDEGEIVFEPFVGSGTSVIAGERCGRRVRAIDIAPEYVDVVIMRWLKLFPDQPPVLAATQQTFQEVAAERGVTANDRSAN